MNAKNDDSLSTEHIQQRILVIEDEPDIRELIELHLKREGYTVHGAPTGEEGLRLCHTLLPALVLLDLMLPGVDGLEVCKRLKGDGRTRHIPVVMLTARTEESDVVSGLEVGADDYITKPFSPRILVARVRARLRAQAETAGDSQSALRRGRLYIDPGRHMVKVDESQTSLTSTEFKILHLLAQKAGWVFSRYDIVDAVRGDGTIVADRAVDVHIVGLRKKLGPCGEYIETVRGVGYRFKDIPLQ